MIPTKKGEIIESNQFKGSLQLISINKNKTPFFSGKDDSLNFMSNYQFESN